MKSFGNLNPPPVDRSFSHLTEADLRFLERKKLAREHQSKLQKIVLNAVRACPPEIVRTNHLKSVFDSVLTVHQFQYQPNEDDTPAIRCANVSKELNQLGEYL